MRLTKKLLSLLNRVFDKEPGKFLALRLQYDGGMKWRVADGMLYTNVTGGSGSDLTVDLSQYRIADLFSYLADQPGYSLPYGDYSDLSLLSSLVLMDGSNDIAESNGDHIYGYTSVLWSYMEAQANELQKAEVQIGEMLKQMSTKTAQREWLDEIGGFYDVPRLQGEMDDSYGPRIIAEVLRPRANNVAMEAAIKVFTGQETKVTDVVIYGEAFPLYNGQIKYNGMYRHTADRQPIYGLFDVEYGYDLEGSQDIAQFSQIVRDLIDRLRDAGTHLRSLLLRGSEMVDVFTNPPTDTPAIPWVADGAFTETFTAPGDDEFVTDGALGDMADTLDRESESAELAVNYNYRYNGMRRYNGIIYHVGGGVIAEPL